MVSTHMEGLISDIRLSSVVPASVTAENTVRELTNTDLVMKLHYLRAVYLFRSSAVEGQNGLVSELKKALFLLLDVYHPVAGRIRRSEDGRPLIKCNDGGVRIAEAQANKTLQEWMEINDYDQLTYNHVLGPDLGYSPLVFIQFTLFKCGGLSVGLSWAHILGDAFSASTFMNMWGQILTGNMPAQISLAPANGKKFQFPSSLSDKPFSLKMVDPIGHDHWLTSNNCKMETHSLHFSAKQLDQFLSKFNGSAQSDHMINPFQALTVVIWKSLAKISGEYSEPRIVTICTSDFQKKGNGILGNNQLVSTVQANFVVAKADALDLAKLIKEKRVEESGLIEELVERENENSDFIVYGANLTFLNLEEADIYEFEMKGQKPVLVNYRMDGIGDQGIVLVLPGSESCGGRTVTMVLPDGLVLELKNELKREWDLI